MNEQTGTQKQMEPHTLGSGRPSWEYNLVQICMNDMGPTAAVRGRLKFTHASAHISSRFTSALWIQTSPPWGSQSAGDHLAAGVAPTQLWTPCFSQLLPAAHLPLTRTHKAQRPSHTRGLRHVWNMLPASSGRAGICIDGLTKSVCWTSSNSQTWRVESE